MPSKSRHSRRKKSFKVSKRTAPVAAVATEQKGTAVPQHQAVVRPRMATPATKSSAIATMTYPFISAELTRIGIISGAIIIILLVLAFVL